MITLIRPLESKIADEIEKRLNEMYAGYKVVHKHISDIVYLIEAGNVFVGEEIKKYLEQSNKHPGFKRSGISDDKFGFDC